MENMVIYAGSFNPVTIAHYNFMVDALNKCNAKLGLFVETSNKYLTKKMITMTDPPSSFILSEEVRKEMIESLFLDDQRIKFGCVELGGESPSTVKTILKLKKLYKDYHVCFLIGADKLSSLSGWKDINLVIDDLTLVVAPRIGINLDDIINRDYMLYTHENNIIILDQNDKCLGVSSTLVRENFFKGLDYSHLLNKGPYKILSKFKSSNFKEVTAEDIIKCELLYGGKYGRTTARKLVYKANLEIFNNWDESLFGNKEEFINNTLYYNKEFIVNQSNNYTTSYDCVNEDCTTVAEMLVNEGLNPAILNLASSTSPGGGYHEGSGAQEESICQQSNLSVSLYQFGSLRYKHIREYNIRNIEGVYPLDLNYGGVYSPNVTFFRNNYTLFYALRQRTFKCGVITLASLSNREKNVFSAVNENCYFDDYGFLNDEGTQIEKNKIRTIYRIAIKNNHDSLVLGAFGCGVFNVYPLDVANLFKDVLEEDEFKGAFKKIVFAIFEGRPTRVHPLVGENGYFKPFYDLFKNK